MHHSFHLLGIFHDVHFLFVWEPYLPQMGPPLILSTGITSSLPCLPPAIYGSACIWILPFTILMCSNESLGGHLLLFSCHPLEHCRFWDASYT